MRRINAHGFAAASWVRQEQISDLPAHNCALETPGAPQRLVKKNRNFVQLAGAF